MNPLDRLLELHSNEISGLHCGCGDYLKGDDKIEHDSLYKKIQEAIEKAEKYDNLSKCNDDVFELGERKYWDIKKFGNFFKVETRMEYSKEKCEELINLIIKAFQMNLSESQNKSLSEENARLKEKIDILENNKAHIPELAFRNGKAYCKKCGSDLE